MCVYRQNFLIEEVNYLALQRRKCSLSFLSSSKRNKTITSRSSRGAIEDNPRCNWVKAFRKEVSKIAWSHFPCKIWYIKFIHCLSRRRTWRLWWRRSLKSLCKLYLYNSSWYFLHKYINIICLPWKEPTLVCLESIKWLKCVSGDSRMWTCSWSHQFAMGETRDREWTFQCWLVHCDVSKMLISIVFRIRVIGR